MNDAMQEKHEYKTSAEKGIISWPSEVEWASRFDFSPIAHSRFTERFRFIRITYLKSSL
jgi:hypothetical protein